MTLKNIDPKARTIVLPSKSNREFFLIHGYTGSPTDFNMLPRYLHERFGAEVKVMLLKGHGTLVSDLDKLSFQDFFDHVFAELKKDIDAGKTIVLGGVSFGAQLALLLAAHFRVAGLFHVCVPYRMRFPFNVPGIHWLKFYKKYWRKEYDPEEKRLRENAFFYHDMHINGLQIAKIGSKNIKHALSKITCPCLMIHSKQDGIGHFLSLEKISRNIGSKIQETKIFDYNIKNHNIFFSPVYYEVCDAIGDFFEKNKIFDISSLQGQLAKRIEYR